MGVCRPGSRKNTGLAVQPVGNGRSRTGCPIFGFTLIELLVVVGIIAILASILLPAMGKSRDKAKEINCISNQKQVISAVLQYVGDYDDTFPWPGYNREEESTLYPYTNWVEAMIGNGYLKGSKGCTTLS